MRRLAAAACAALAAPAFAQNLAAPDFSPLVAPGFAEESLARQAKFVHPFLFPGAVPRLGARVAILAGSGWKGGVDLDQIAVLSMYALELQAPMLVIRESDTRTTDRFRAYIRAPWALAPAHQLAIVLGWDLSGASPLSSPAGVSTAFAYAYGGDPWSGQLRAGLGHDRFPGAQEDVLRPIIWIDGSAQVRFGPHFAAALDAEYKHNLARPGHALRLWPGVRFFPLGDARLSIGAAALVWIEGTPPGPEELRRFGFALDLGYHLM